MHGGRVFFDLNTSANSHPILGQSDKRQRITFYAPSAGTVTLANQSPVTAGQGITLTAGMSPLYLDTDYHGNCIQQEWYAIYTNSGQGLAWIETLCEESHEHHGSPPNNRNARQRQEQRY